MRFSKPLIQDSLIIIPWFPFVSNITKKRANGFLGRQLDKPLDSQLDKPRLFSGTHWKSTCEHCGYHQCNCVIYTCFHVLVWNKVTTTHEIVRICWTRDKEKVRLFHVWLEFLVVCHLGAAVCLLPRLLENGWMDSRKISVHVRLWYQEKSAIFSDVAFDILDTGLFISFFLWGWGDCVP